MNKNLQGERIMNSDNFCSTFEVVKKVMLLDKSVEELINVVEEIARAEFDGHYTIYSFTTNYRVFFNTVDDVNINRITKGFPTLKAALIDAILNKTNACDYKFDMEEYLNQDWSNVI